MAPPKHKVSDSVKKLVADALGDFAKRNPDGPIKAIDLNKVDIRDLIKTLLQPRVDILQDIEERVRKGQLPLGVLSTAARRRVGEALVHRAAGLIYAATASEEEFELEVSDAQSAIDTEVVLDASALYIAMISGHAVQIRRSFDALLLTKATVSDLNETARSILGLAASDTTIGIDPSTGDLQVTQLTELQRALTVERAENLRDLAEICRIVSVDQYQSFSAVASTETAAWIDPLEFAAQNGIALYSDDKALRMVARELSIPAFGTLSLLHVMIERGDVSDETEKTIRMLMREYVVDMPCRVEDIAALAQENEYEPGPASFALTRGATWANQVDTSDLFGLLAIVHQQKPEADEAWLRSALLGIYEATPGSDAYTIAAANWSLSIAAFTPESFALALRAARAIAAHKKIPDPRESIENRIREAVANFEFTFPVSEAQRNAHVDRVLAEVQ